MWAWLDARPDYGLSSAALLEAGSRTAEVIPVRDCFVVAGGVAASAMYWVSMMTTKNELIVRRRLAFLEGAQLQRRS